MPGAAHSTLGFAKFYAMTAQAAADPARRDAAWKFIEYMGGGDYAIAKRWAVEKGLGFAPAAAVRRPGRAARPGRAGSTRRSSSSRRRSPRTAPGPSGPGSGPRISGRCSPRRWSARPRSPTSCRPVPTSGSSTGPCSGASERRADMRWRRAGGGPARRRPARPGRASPRAPAREPTPGSGSCRRWRWCCCSPSTRWRTRSGPACTG